MHHLVITLCLVALASLARAETPAESDRPVPVAPAAQNAAPTDLTTALAELKRVLPPDFIAEFRSLPEDESILYVFTLGSWMQHHWGLAGDTALTRYFRKLGVSHTEDMAAMVVYSLWRDLNGKSVNLKDQVRRYKSFQRKLERDRKKMQS